MICWLLDWLIDWFSLYLNSVIFIHWSPDWLIDWLIDWFFISLIGLIAWLIDCIYVTVFQEWSVIEAPVDEATKLRNFYRAWCLKESFVKALGVGINYKLARIDFDLPQEAQRDRAVSLSLDEIDQKDWHFSEFFIDAQHIGATAIKLSPEHATVNQTSPDFAFVTVEDIAKKLEPIANLNSDLGLQFINKQDGPSWLKKLFSRNSFFPVFSRPKSQKILLRRNFAEEKSLLVELWYSVD